MGVSVGFAKGITLGFIDNVLLGPMEEINVGFIEINGDSVVGSSDGDGVDVSIVM